MTTEKNDDKVGSDRPASVVASQYPDITSEMIASGIAYFETASEDRFPPEWSGAEALVVGVYRAMRMMEVTRLVDPPE